MTAAAYFATHIDVIAQLVHQKRSPRLEATRVRRLKRLIFDQLNWFFLGLENLESIEDRRPDRGYSLFPCCGNCNLLEKINTSHDEGCRHLRGICRQGVKRLNGHLTESFEGLIQFLVFRE